MNAAAEDRSRAELALPLLVGLIVAAPLALTLVNPSTNTLIVCAIGAVLAVPVAMRAVTGAFDPFEPIFVFVVAYGVMFVLRPASMISRNDFSYSIAGQGVDIQESFRQALVIGLVGAIGFVAGYLMDWGPRIARRLKAPPSRVVHSRAIVAGFVLAALGIGLFWLFLATSGGGRSGLDLFFAGRSLELTQSKKGSTAYLYTSPLLTIGGTLILFAFGLARRSARLLAASAVGTVVLFVILGPVGSRTALLPLGLGLAVVYYTTRGSRPRTLSLVVAAAIALFVSVVLLDVRDERGREAIGLENSISNTLSDPERAFDPLTKGDDAGMVPALASGLTVIPDEVGYKYGTGIITDVLARPIPRALWSGKPRQPKEQVINARWPDLYSTGVANPEFSVGLSFYVDGHLVGVLLGYLLYGVLARILWEYFRRHSTTVTARVLFAASLPFLVSAVRDTPVDTLQRVAFVALPAVVALYFVAGPSWERWLGRVRAARA